MAKKKVVIIGAGAAGMVAGIVAARNGAKVTMLEHKNRVGKKILATGNGRCNISNRVISGDRFHSDTKNIFEDIYKQFDLDATLEFFRSIGVEILELEDGKLYPFSLQAASVLNVLRDEMERLKINVVCDAKVLDIATEGKVVVTCKDKKYYGDNLILATGGRSTPDLGSDGSGYKLAKSIGLKVVKSYPSLVQLVGDYPYLKHLKGTKVMAKLTLVIDGQKQRSEYGELLFTDYGLSGPPILQLSREASKVVYFDDKKPNVVIEGDLIPNLEEEELDKILIGRIESMPYKTIEQFFVGLLPKQLIIPVIKDNGLSIDDKAANLTKKDRQGIVQWLKHFTVPIVGVRQWNQSQVTAGGVDCREVDDQTLKSIKHDNVYLCGELLDIDADSGGFNLQWAWSSGFVTGLNASKE